jgi:uncharacterized membrane protein YeaQ/YmgE (transglycosylase-associated protein family)
MGILTWILFGLVVGVVASWIMPSRFSGGIVADILIGIVGAFVGGWIFGAFGHSGVTGFNIPSMLCALVGAVVLLWLSRVFSSNRSAI